MKYDAVIVLAKNWEVGPNGKYRLTLDSKMNALAAAQLFEEKVANQFIICGGVRPIKSNNGYAPKTESIEMRDYAIRHSDLKPIDFMIDLHSYDTPSNAEETRRMIGTRQFKKLGLLTTTPHLTRSLEIFDNYGFRCEGISSDDVIARRSDHHKDLVVEVEKSLARQIDYFKETILTPLAFIEPTGKLPRMLTKVLPSRRVS